MNAAIASLLVAAGFSVWIFTKLQNKTGYGNNESALKGAALAFVVIFIILFTIAYGLKR